MMAGVAPDASRLGAVEAAAALVASLGLAIVPFVSLVMVPLMGAMADPLPGVRMAAAASFGSLVGLLPLTQGVPLPSGLTPWQLAAAEKDAVFLSQLLDNSKVSILAQELWTLEKSPNPL